MGRRGRAGGPVSAPCGSCGERRLVAVLIPGHEDVEAVVCLACGAVQRDGAAVVTDTSRLRGSPEQPHQERTPPMPQD